VIAALAGAGIARAAMIQLEHRLLPFWALSVACTSALIVMIALVAALDGERLRATVFAVVRRER
jgi:hypothetical protein